jgi:hypothetical protein
MGHFWAKKAAKKFDRNVKLVLTEFFTAPKPISNKAVKKI